MAVLGNDLIDTMHVHVILCKSGFIGGPIHKHSSIASEYAQTACLAPCTVGVTFRTVVTNRRRDGTARTVFVMSFDRHGQRAKRTVEAASRRTCSRRASRGTYSAVQLSAS